MKKHPDFKSLTIIEHPLIQHKLTHMRDKKTGKALFKILLKEISLLMGFEIARTLKTTMQKIETPICEMDAPVLADKAPVIVPILRAGLGMSEGLEELIPTAEICHVGLYRDEETHQPVEYLVKLPEDLSGRTIILVDPMLATGNSAVYTIKLLKDRNADMSQVRFMALLAAPEGVKTIEDQYPEVEVFVAALDERLNEKAYIVPGLGDAGDRVFGTL